MGVLGIRIPAGGSSHGVHVRYCVESRRGGSSIISVSASAQGIQALLDHLLSGGVADGRLSVEEGDGVGGSLVEDDNHHLVAEYGVVAGFVPEVCSDQPSFHSVGGAEGLVLQ